MAGGWVPRQGGGVPDLKDAGRDVMTSRTVGPLGLNPENLHETFGVSEAEYDRMLDDTFGPSPEARAQAEAAQQQAGGER
ncbi:hypothetical protein ABZ330_31945 [Streptomyces sp. NPDC006172]|uniref:hypothetical protein n=1 Tax=Streptomyces sp. NPDC006172 TaxID=3154470 RepID=UPI003404ADAA